MLEMEEGYVAVAESCTKVNKDTNLAHTVIGVFCSAEEAKLACELRAGHLEDFIKKDNWHWARDIWSARTNSGETIYGITHIGEKAGWESYMALADRTN